MLHEAIYLATCNANKRCVASCKKKFTCNTPFCNCNCCVASCKKSRTTLYFSQRCETSCLRVPSPQQLATQFLSEWTNQSSSFARGRFPPSCLLLYALQVAKKVANVWHPLCNLKGFLFVIVALQVARKIASCDMALKQTAVSRLCYDEASPDRDCICELMIFSILYTCLFWACTENGKEIITLATELPLQCISWGVLKHLLVSNLGWMKWIK